MFSLAVCGLNSVVVSGLRYQRCGNVSHETSRLWRSCVTACDSYPENSYLLPFLSLTAQHFTASRRGDISLDYAGKVTAYSNPVTRRNLHGTGNEIKNKTDFP